MAAANPREVLERLREEAWAEGDRARWSRRHYRALDKVDGAYAAVEDRERDE